MGSNVVVMGTQWGDEGKGKIVDLLTDQAAVAAFCHRLADSSSTRVSSAPLWEC